ncbi:MAG: TIR domain-containing protein, partial [Acidobacteriota bacterium]|nr:TIR domain-containing protein [Acidobacteriota bacterium]
STHGQQFWVVDELGTRRKVGTECDAILWDLAGQPDYRLTHALFLDDADLALVLFDPTDSRDPLHGVEFWLKQLKSGRRKSGEARDCCPTILVGARADRGDARLAKEELEEFCRRRGIGGGYLATSAKEGGGLKELLRRMKEQIAWEEKSATVTTATFKRIKDYVLGLKENRRRRRVIVSSEELRKRLEKLDETWEFTDDEMMTAVGHLANYGYVRVLRTSEGEERVLLSPELLNNLAASFVLEARRNPRGLGSLEESRLLAGEYQFRELEKLSEEERDILLDSAALLFLEHNVCFRETALDARSYLVFPELINLKKPILDDEQAMEDGASYTVSGAVENVYALLVVLLGYTQTFTRTDQWQNQARYVMGDGSTCGFRQEDAREGELDFVLYFGANVPGAGRKIFEGLFEGFLARRKVTVFRYEPVECPRGHAINRGVVRGRLRDGKDFAFCEECGERAVLPKADESVRLTQDEQRKVDQQRWFADRRSQFEQAVFRLSSYVDDQGLGRPECFISYAWGDREQERWVEKSLATDLQKAGLRVLLDKWENSRVGSNVMRFVERIEECDYLIVVGTPLYRKKARNVASAKGSVVAAEWDLAGIRLLAAEAQKKTIMPVLLAGEESEAFPPLLRGQVFADFRDERNYFAAAFDLILSIYNIPFNHQAVADLRDSLSESALPERAGRVR